MASGSKLLQTITLITSGITGSFIDTFWCNLSSRCSLFVSGLCPPHTHTHTHTHTHPHNQTLSHLPHRYTYTHTHTHISVFTLHTGTSSPYSIFDISNLVAMVSYKETKTKKKMEDQYICM